VGERKILAVVFLTLISIGILLVSFGSDLSVEKYWVEIGFCLLWYGLMTWFIIRLVSRVRIDITRLVGKIPQKTEILFNTLWAIPLASISIGGIWLIFLPLSYLFPNFVDFWLIEDSFMIIWPTGSIVGIANFVNFGIIIIIVPIVEEFIFRGLLLSRWFVKWGVPRAVIVSSIIFGLMHVDVVGGIVFGYVMAILYIKTKSLIIPMAVHSANNLIYWLLALWVTLSQNSITEYTLFDFQSNWWIGTIGLIIGLPWVIRFIITNRLRSSLQIPYFA